MSDTEQPTTEQPATPEVDIPANLPILPLKGVVVFPLTPVPLMVGQARSIRLVDDVMHGRGNRLLGLVCQKDPDQETPGPDDIYQVGVVARIIQLARRPDGVLMLAVQGLERMRVTEYTSTEPYLMATVERLADREEQSLEAEAMRRTLITQFQRAVTLAPYLPGELELVVGSLEDTRQLVYLIAANLQMDVEPRQRVLEAETLTEKMQLLSTFLTRELEVLELGQKIQGRAQEEMTKAQREYYLREQLKAIQRELGEEDQTQAEIGQLRQRIAESKMPAEPRKQAERELSRLERLPSASPEHSVIRTYIDWLLVMPWGVATEQKIDVVRARQILNDDHYDLEKVKDRILEYLAVRKMKQGQRAARLAEAASSDTPLPDEAPDHEPILCFVGPPGVGKTSLGQSIARALGRTFTRMSLGGVRDEAEIRGHRRTYIGAMPGRFIQTIRRVETSDPVIMLDEIDKVGADWRGDPSSALLEVLDPEQNRDFRDNYLDVPFDLSNVLFITTANSVETIPAPLLDRMEVLQLVGYTEDEKVQIARRYLLSKQVRVNGLLATQLECTDAALRAVVRDYTREAGVRNLERQIGTLCRKVAREFAEGTRSDQMMIDVEQVAPYLGRQQYFSETAERTARAGVATGLVWTPAGGDIVFVEASAVPGRDDRLILTGQLGDVMKESAQAALTCVRAASESLGIAPQVWLDTVIHIHVPAGAQPKDGPSAGVTMATALASLMTNRPTQPDLAMTGEITLRGKVLPVGGVKEKVLGAHRAGVRTVILPRRNEKDLDDLPADLRAEMTFVLADDIQDVWKAALRDVTEAAAEHEARASVEDHTSSRENARSAP